jgi:hypothetical protein
VLVVVAIMGGVPVPVVDIVDMVAMLDSFMAAARLVCVAVIGVGYMRERVLVVMPLVGRMRVTIVHVVGVSIVLDGGMPAAWTVLMGVLGMDFVHVRSHCSSVRMLTSLSSTESAQARGQADGVWHQKLCQAGPSQHGPRAR